MGHLVPGSGAGHNEFTRTDEKVTELDLSAPEQPIREPAMILKRGFNKPKTNAYSDILDDTNP